MGVNSLSDRPHSSELPRYFVVQKEDDVIILDLKRDRYLWRAGVRVDGANLGQWVSGDDKAVMQRIQPPHQPGYPPRGRDRFWKFDLPLVLRALFALISAHRMTSNGFGRFADKLNFQLSNADIAEQRPLKLLSEISSAMEWARLLFPFEAKCLPMSIATAKLARHFGFEANLVIGVQSLPLKAHAWVQVHGSLVNDFMDRVNFFRPIMTLPYDHTDCASDSQHL